MLKKAIFRAYVSYLRFSPLNKGKSLLGRILTKVFKGSMLVKVGNIFLDMLPSSSMDISYFYAHQNESHKVVITEIEKLKEGNVFIDVGANIGFFSYIASKKVGDNGFIFAFEPSLREFRRLVNANTLNKTRNIIFLNCALGQQTNLIKLFLGPEGHTGLNSLHNDTLLLNNFQFAQQFPLDNVFNLQKEISLIKIDVEGHEMSVLMGMNQLLEQKMIKKIIVEITPHLLVQAGSSKEELYSYLINYGFKPLLQKEIWQYDEIFELMTP